MANGAEGEPATFKDRAIMRANPYQVVEGVAIAALTIGAREAFIGVKASFEPEVEALSRAIDEMQAAGMAGDVPIVVVGGPDEYLFGEEKALLEVIEGKPPLPRLLPPYLHGLFATSPQMGWESVPIEPGHQLPEEGGAIDASNPTLVNNVETLANVAHILARGPEWFRSMGTDESPGHHVATVVGDVARPGVGEIDLGTPLSEVIDAVGGGPASGTDDQGGVLGRGQRGDHRRPAGNARVLRGHAGGGHRHGRRRLTPSTTTPPAWSTSPSSSRSSSTWSRADSARRASSGWARSATA